LGQATARWWVSFVWFARLFSHICFAAFVDAYFVSYRLRHGRICALLNVIRSSLAAWKTKKSVVCLHFLVWTAKEDKEIGGLQV